MIDFATTGLPVVDVLGAVNDALDSSGNAVLIAPAGAGKTTLVPLALTQADWARGQRLIMLEPRRLAARSAARRMTHLIGDTVGGQIGYRMRLETKVSNRTRVEVVTEGVFARMIVDDPELAGIAGVIFDEFHERSLDADLSLALALDAKAALRPDLRLLIMSATLDGGRVAQLIGQAPVIESRGRTFPVEIRYAPRKPDERIEDAVTSAVLAAVRDETGSILAFLPGQAEIGRAAERLEARLPADCYVVPLFGAMQIADQDKAIAPAEPGRRKIVLATAIAESSVTIDGVRIVIDSGLSRQPAFEPGNAITRLETVRASRASADQRAGRAGRTQPGLVMRLWHEGQTAAMPPFDPPEIARTDLSRLVLDCLAWGETDPARLAFLDPPPAPALAAARQQLAALGAIDAAGGLTAKGKAMRSIGLPAPLAAMVCAAANRAVADRRAQLALLISERGLGGKGSDLEHRWAAFARDRSDRAQRVKTMARRIASNLDLPVNLEAERDTTETVGAMLLDAFPDRLARARSGQPGRFVMANGRGLELDEADPLAAEAFIVAADVTGTAARGRLLAGAPVALFDIEARLGDRIEDIIEHRFDPATGQLTARAMRRLGAVILASAPRPVQSSADTVHALLSAVHDHGLTVLQWDEGALALRARLAWLHARQGDAWPAVDDATLMASLDLWLAPFLAGRTSLADLPLRAALLLYAGQPDQTRIDQLAPSHFTAPTGSRIRLVYPEDGAAPVLPIRVQELYGLSVHPTIADGAVPLLIELLSPASRPIQRTGDLPAFWAGSWRDVRAQMRGRYPKHVWPDDPATAVPTRRAKPR